MPSELHANTFFHFTNNFGAFTNIIKNGFFPRYSLEKFLGGLESIRKYIEEHLGKDEISELTLLGDIGIPMVCFCDIRLSQAKNHVFKYGNYALGLKKEWKDKTEISPVLYIDTKNSATNHIINAFFGRFLLLHGPFNEKNIVQNFKDHFFNLACFVKPYEGKKWNKVNNQYNEDMVNFYDEREWRYVPPINIQRLTSKEDLPPQLLPSKFFNDKKTIERFNKFLEERYPLKFDPDDIKYLIVNNDTDLSNAVKFIHSLDNLDTNQKNILLTKLLTVSQIFEDF
jgi:hypothetical protein